MQFKVMQIKSGLLAAGLAAVLAAPASAATFATATTPLNIRSGPGPRYAVIGAIPARGRASIVGCIKGSLWCEVRAAGKRGWAYAEYLDMRLSGRSLILAENLNTIPTVTYRAPVETVGSAGPPPLVTGTLVAPAAGQPLVIAPPPATVRSYVVEHPVDPVYLNGEVVSGAGLPSDVALAPIPGYQYQYAYVNNQPVLVEPQTRRVEYIYR